MTNVTKTTESTETVVTATSAASKIQRKYKDTLFSMLFSEKKNLLSLYNALNKTTYTNVDDLEITTLENALYMNYKNDISFVFDFELMLYEHQSTINPNMPLRDLFYVSTVLKGRVKDENLYGQALIKIPAPRFVVLYNGTEEQPERQILRLSDSYEKKQGTPELELTVVVYNINWGHNKELLEAVDMCIFEFNEEKFLKSEREWTREEGRKEGHKSGLVKGEQRLLQLLNHLKDSGQNEDLSRALSDKGYREQLYQQYNL
ncbi:MAG: hypothetical protein J1E98_07300 [Lachnospiraceae bacterium]|nr:hypothetical protein [Lachnospiraceae bacterium]